ncbi:MAG: DUF934 domain-containing protein [Motiliproteus sp.]|nr:DUF934 domain-containing protein [Motiliproteus sp.]MCW9052713.1 DUF934 domain-containing protein [Motiliproteus sp.]
MPLIIDQQPVQQDSWTYLASEEGVAPDLSSVADSSDLLVDWSCFQQCKEQLLGRSGGLGVRIDGFANLDELSCDLDQLSLVAIEFPSFADGRGFSQARLLRDSLGFAGQIRAVGDVTWDRLRFMHRCGFDAMEVSEDRYSEDMLKAFGEIEVRLQGAADDPRPIYRQ